MKKRALSLVMISVLIITMLAGCGKSTDTKNASATPTASAVKEEAKDTEGTDSETKDTEAKETESAKPVSISFYTTETGKDDVFQDIITHFQDENPNITVEYIAAGDDQLQKWMSLYASKEGPTVALMDPVNIFENKDRMRAYKAEDGNLLNNVVESSLSCYTYDGQVYGMPMSAAGFGLLYNKMFWIRQLVEPLILQQLRPEVIWQHYLRRLRQPGLQLLCLPVSTGPLAHTTLVWYMVDTVEMFRQEKPL
jgi:raffinose/stachyose/melibiose transport system substrate-binding protein